MELEKGNDKSPPYCSAGLGQFTEHVLDNLLLQQFLTIPVERSTKCYLTTESRIRMWQVLRSYSRSALPLGVSIFFHALCFYILLLTSLSLWLHLPPSLSFLCLFHKPLPLSVPSLLLFNFQCSTWEGCDRESSGKTGCRTPVGAASVLAEQSWWWGLTGLKACVSGSRWVSSPGFVMGMDEASVLET